MNDEDKSKKRIINELEELHHQIRELEALEAKHKWAEEAIQTSANGKGEL